MQSTSESLLLQLTSADHSDAWRRFVQLYTPLIFYWSRKTGLSQHDSADLVQDVLTIVYQKLPHWKYDPSKSFRGWLRTITLNRRREILRRKRIRRADARDGDLENIADPRQAESTWDLDYGKQLVAAAMEVLKNEFAPETWQALTLQLSSGRTVAEISRETGVSVWTIYSAKNRLMARLRLQLDGLMD